MMSINKKLFALLAFLFAIVTYFFSNAPFVWDKDLLDSRQAFWFIENNFSLVLPTALDPGHPPMVGLILASLWTLFGQNLAVGHWFMYLLTLGTIWQIIKFADYHVEKRFLILFFFIVFLDPTLLTQTIIVSSDLILIFFFLYSLNSIFYKKENHLYISLVVLALVNMRGTLTVGGIFIFHLFFLENKKKIQYRVREIFKFYIPSLILPIAFYIFHFIKIGWVGYHELSPWAQCYEKVGLLGMVRNTLVLGWRFIDFGRIILWLFVFYFFVREFKNIEWDKKLKDLILLQIVMGGILLPPMIISQNLLSPRYIIPLFFVFEAFVVYLLVNTSYFNLQKKIIIGTIFILSLLGGNFWRYPEKIAQAWDSTLGHLPYYKLKKEIIDYIKTQNINFVDVASVTPDKYPLKYYYLNGTEYGFVEKKELYDHKYIYYSNYHNEYTDSEIEELNSKWQLIKEEKSYPMFVRLYKNPNYE